MIQKISFADTRTKSGMIKYNKVQNVLVAPNSPSVVSFTANKVSVDALLKGFGSAIKGLFANPVKALPKTDPYLNKNLDTILTELKGADIFKPKSILKETDSGHVLSLIHPVDGGMERVISFDKQGEMTNLIVYHPDNVNSKREFSNIYGGIFTMQDYKY